MTTIRLGGVMNTAAQGYPVSLLYGKRRIGGAIISAGIMLKIKCNRPGESSNYFDGNR